jgi:hypothetical protein
MGVFIDPNNQQAYDQLQVLQAAAVATGAGNVMKVRGWQVGYHTESCVMAQSRKARKLGLDWL